MSGWIGLQIYGWLAVAGVAVMLILGLIYWQAGNIIRLKWWIQRRDSKAGKRMHQ